MPTNEVRPEFFRDYARLTPEQKVAFKGAVDRFVADLRRGRFRAGLRVKAVQGHPGIFEMTWGGSGRATFEYGSAVLAGEPHIRWRRIGGHEIFQNP